MKSIMKTAGLAATAVLVWGPVSCRKPEAVELASYPEVRAGLSISGAEGKPSVIPLHADYDGDGVLKADGDLSRTYVLSLSSPSPEDVTVWLEAIHTGLPAEYVGLEKNTLTIPAGQKSAAVDVVFKPEDLSFAPEAAEVYEIGVRVIGMTGFQTAFEGEAEAKVVVEKAAYLSEATVVTGESETGTVRFRRRYLDGAVINEDPMTFDLKVKLDRPATEDLALPVRISGLPAGQEGAAVFSEAAFKVAAGGKESENVITCNISDEFLLGDGNAALFELHVEIGTGDRPSVAAGSPLTVEIRKTTDLVMVAGPDEFAALSKYDPSGWTGSGDGSGDIESLFDGVKTGYNDYYYFFQLQIDMQEVLPVDGFIAYAYAGSIRYLPDRLRIEISEDGENWTSLGVVEDGRSGGNPQHIRFLKTVHARYIKYISLEENRTATDFVEFEVYHE